MREFPSLLYKRLCIVEHVAQKNYVEVPPEWVKHDYIRGWARHTGYEVFVETGTYRCTTTMAVADAFRDVYSIELDRTLYEEAVARMRRYENVQLFNGDSAIVINDILPRLSEPAIFWLDAHWCGGVTGKSLKDPPIRNELEAIFAHPVKEHVILVDDARSFTGYANYPTIKQVIRHVHEKSRYQLRVFHDIIHIYRELT
jgi:hypothetical protein